MLLALSPWQALQGLPNAKRLLLKVNIAPSEAKHGSGREALNAKGHLDGGFRQAATNRTLRLRFVNPDAAPTSHPGGGFPDAQPTPALPRRVHFYTESPVALEQHYAVMAKNKKVHATVPPVADAVVRRVNTRLSRMEDLLLEMRAEQDVKLKKIEQLQQQVEELMAIQQPRRLWR